MKYGPWKIWNGGECPVSPETRVLLQLARWTREQAEKDVPCKAEDCEWEWHQGGLDGDIIAYREVIEPVERVGRFAINFDDSREEPIVSGHVPDDGHVLSVNLWLTLTARDGEIDWSTAKIEEA